MMAGNTAPPDLFLARRAAAGQADAWDELISRYGRRIYSIAFQFAGNRLEAEDLTQEVFLKVYQNLHRYRGDVPLAGWALRLSRNLCIDHYRRCRRERCATFTSDEVLEAQPATDDLQAQVERREQLRLVYRTLEDMPEELATVLMLRDLQGWAYEEIAVFMDLPLGTLKSRLSRGRKELVRRITRSNGAAGGDIARTGPHDPLRLASW